MKRKWRNLKRWLPALVLALSLLSSLAPEGSLLSDLSPVTEAKAEGLYYYAQYSVRGYDAMMVKDTTGFRNAIAEVTSSGSSNKTLIRLEADLTLMEQFYIYGDLVIDLNGHTLSRGINFDAREAFLHDRNNPKYYDYDTRMFFVCGGGTLTLVDDKDTTYKNGSGGRCTGGNVEGNGGFIYVAKGGTFVMESGKIDHCRSHGNGGGTTGMDVTFDAQITLPTSMMAPTRAGYVLDGYYDQPNGQNATKYIAWGNADATVEYTNPWTEPNNKTLYSKIRKLEEMLLKK